MKKRLALLAALAAIMAGLGIGLSSASAGHKTNFGYHWPRNMLRYCGPGCLSQHDFADQTVYLKPILNKAVDPTNKWATALQQAYTDWSNSLNAAGFNKIGFIFNTTDGCPNASTTYHWICVGFYSDPNANYYGATAPVNTQGDYDHLQGYQLTIATGKIDHDFGSPFGNYPGFLTRISRHEAGHTIALAHDSLTGVMNPTLSFGTPGEADILASHVSDIIANHNHAP